MNYEFIDYLEKTKLHFYKLWLNCQEEINPELREATDELLIAYNQAITQYKREQTHDCECWVESLDNGSLIIVEKCNECESINKDSENVLP